MSERNCEEEFYEWAKKNLFLSKSAIIKDQVKNKVAISVISALELDRITLGERKITLKLAEPVGDISEVTANLRAKTNLAQLLTSSKPEEAQLKLVEAITNTPISIVKEFDFIDFRFLGELAGFLL